MTLDITDEARWAAILGIIRGLARDKSIPSHLRERCARTEREWEGLPSPERDSEMSAFLAELELDRYLDHARGADQLRRLWPPGGPGGALPAPDDTPWAPPRRARKP